MKDRGTIRNTITIAENVAFPSLRKGKGFKLLLFFAQEVEKKLQPGSVHEIPLSAVRKLLRIKDLSQQMIASMMEELEQLKLDWNAYDPEWVGFSNIVSSCRYNSGRDVLRYSFDPDFIAEYLRTTTPFKNLPIALVMGFRSNYALKIYELAYQYYDPKRKAGKTPQYSNKELRAKFGIKESQYKTGGLFLRDVIKKPLKEANKLGEYEIEFHSNKRRGSLLCYWFSIKIAPQTKFLLNCFENRDQRNSQDDEASQVIIDKEMALRAKLFIEFWKSKMHHIDDILMTKAEKKTWFSSLLDDSCPTLSVFAETWILDNFFKPSDSQKEKYQEFLTDSLK